MSTNCHRPQPRRGRTLTVSAAAAIAAATGLAGHDAHAGDVTVGASYINVYGNSVGGNPSARDGAASPSNNTLTLIAGASIAQDAYGAWADLAAAGGNAVVMTGGTVGNVYGGYVYNFGNATSNSVAISGGTISGQTYGGYTWMGDALSNSITITGGAIGSDVTGGYTEMGNTLYNNVIITGGALGTTQSPIGVYGSYATGGYAIGNTVTIGGDATIHAYQVRGGYSLMSHATGNSVTITGGTITAEIAGGVGYDAATGNSVTISGGAITAPSIIGGTVDRDTATENTITILGTPSISPGVVLQGGSCATPFCTDLFTGNTLNLKMSGLTVGSLSNFQFLNFYLPTGLTAGGTMLNVTGTADLTSGAASSTVNVGFNGASSPLAVGDAVTLIHAGTLRTNANLNTTGTGLQGVTLAYVFGIGANGTDLTATVTSVGVNAGSKALSEGYVAAAALLNQGADLVSGTGMANAIAAADNEVGMFGAMAGGMTRTRTGSHVDVDGFAVMAGLARGFDVGAGQLTTAAFADYGSGSYDTFNGFATGDIHGGGHSHTFGGGLLGHMDFAATGPGHAYIEASARVGRADNSFSSADLTSGGVAAGYDAASTHYGAGAGAGYVWTLSKAAALDLYGRYAWSRLDGDSVRLTTGETVDFAAIDSRRSQLGGRLTYALADGIAPHVGAAWEHEFDGKARATSNGLALATPSMQGDTGILEAGLTLRPTAARSLTLDVDVKGFLGQREGVAGTLQAKLAL